MPFSISKINVEQWNEKKNNKVKKKKDVGPHQLFKLITRDIILGVLYMEKQWNSILKKT